MRQTSELLMMLWKGFAGTVIYLSQLASAQMGYLCLDNIHFSITIGTLCNLVPLKDYVSTSITESKHIDAVKKPWRRTNHFEELKQMLLINQRMDKLASFRARLFGEGLLNVPLVPEGTEPIAMDSDSDTGGLALDSGSDNSASESEDDGSGSATQESDVHLRLDNSGTDKTYIEAILILPGKPGEHGSLMESMISTNS